MWDCWRQTGHRQRKPRAQSGWLSSTVSEVIMLRAWPYYQAVIEKSTPDGAGQVDASLERDEYRFACEISVTSTDQQELANIEKCLAGDYDKVILCSPKKRSLQRVKKLVAERLEESDQDRVLFLEPEELVLYLEEETGDEAVREQRVKGYMVKVRHQPVKEAEERAKREAKRRRERGGGGDSVSSTGADPAWRSWPRVTSKDQSTFFFPGRRNVEYFSELVGALRGCADALYQRRQSKSAPSTVRPG